jgi:hypothetical protein
VTAPGTPVHFAPLWWGQVHRRREGCCGGVTAPRRVGTTARPATLWRGQASSRPAGGVEVSPLPGDRDVPVPSPGERGISVTPLPQGSRPGRLGGGHSLPGSPPRRPGRRSPIGPARTLTRPHPFPPEPSPVPGLTARTLTRPRPNRPNPRPGRQPYPAASPTRPLPPSPTYPPATLSRTAARISSESPSSSTAREINSAPTIALTAAIARRRMSSSSPRRSSAICAM